MRTRSIKKSSLRAPKMAPGSVHDSQASGGYEGASRTSKALASWNPPIRSPDLDLNRDKPLLDARSRDMVRNDGYANGAVAIHRDSIVGGQYVINAQPDFLALGATEEWAEEFQRVVESEFTLWAESDQCWPDAARLNTFTGLIRLGVGLSVLSGEILSTVEWLRSSAQRRPYSTAIQMVDPDRLSNPNDQADTKFLRRGIEKDKYGAPLAYHFRMAHPSEGFMDGSRFAWRRVPTRKPWGRLQVIHIYEQTRPDQSRGVSEMVSVLKQMNMTSKYQDIVLQNAVLNATYAATIESELPPEVVWETMGAGGDSAVAKYLDQLAEYSGGAKALHLDGLKIPHLFPGTKLNLQNAGQPGGVGTGYEESLLRKIAAALGLSYEQFSRDYTKTNYSSARASMVETFKAMQAKKKVYADRLATAIYALWLEEAINAGRIPLPNGAGPEYFYEGMNREALMRCEWIGASRGQIDELKETQAALLRIEGGLSTYEAEIARGGSDFRRVFAQRKREKALMEEMGLDFGSQATKPSPLAKSRGKKPGEVEDEEETEDEEA